jgi:hypothetical protein
VPTAEAASGSGVAIRQLGQIGTQALDRGRDSVLVGAGPNGLAAGHLAAHAALRRSLN